METEHHTEKETDFSYSYEVTEKWGKEIFTLILEQNQHMSAEHVILVSCNPFQKLAILKQSMDYKVRL